MKCYCSKSQINNIHIFSAFTLNHKKVVKKDLNKACRNSYMYMLPILVNWIHTQNLLAFSSQVSSDNTIKNLQCCLHVKRLLCNKIVRWIDRVADSNFFVSSKFANNQREKKEPIKGLTTWVFPCIALDLKQILNAFKIQT